VAKQIAEQLYINLTPEEAKRIDYKPTDNFEALKLYQKGRLLADNRTLKDLESSIEYYQKAIELDPNYAEAYAEIANSYYIMDGFGQINRDKINSYVEKAFAINPNTARAYTVKAMIYRKDEHWEKAKEYFEKAIDLNPNDAIAHHYYGIFLNKSPDRDIKNYLIHIDLAQKLDPLSTPINSALITALLTHYKVKEAEEHLKKVSFSLTDISKIGNKQKIINKKCEIVSLKKKDWTEAIRFYQKAIEEDPDYSFLYGELAFYYNVVLNDDKNRVKCRKKAYELDSTKFLTAAGLYFSLIENEKFNEAERLVETKNYKSIVKERGKLFELHGSFCYYYFKKDYKKAQEILAKTLKNELYFDKMLVLAQLGKKNDVYQLLIDHNDMVNSRKAFIFALLKDKDSMYHYLNRISSVYIDSKWINGRTELDPYRKEERYKAFLKKNYLPITHWNE
ncbi:MAG: tetratricopeptide repeat protein, partial [Flavobacteriaceae bacterium]|nr:tetratricopeptide repeat protein [Flavobacteriaceae bacterium]